MFVGQTRRDGLPGVRHIAVVFLNLDFFSDVRPSTWNEYIEIRLWNRSKKLTDSWGLHAPYANGL